MKWEKLTSLQIEKVNRDTPVILNIAAIEQHGPHLPLETDAAIGQHFLDELDKANPNGQLILPQIKVCCSAHHLDYSGTLSVPHNVLADYVEAILESVANDGFRNIVILNSHGGNQAIGSVIVERFGVSHPKNNIALITWWSLIHEELLKISESQRFGTGHACELETSLMMIIGAIPEDTELPTGLSYNHSFNWANGSMLYPAKATFYRSMKEISGGNGIVGQPDVASLEKGEAITRAFISAFAEVINDLKNTNPK